MVTVVVSMPGFLVQIPGTGSKRSSHRCSFQCIVGQNGSRSGPDQPAGCRGVCFRAPEVRAGCERTKK